MTGVHDEYQQLKTLQDDIQRLYGKTVALVRDDAYKPTFSEMMNVRPTNQRNSTEPANQLDNEQRIDQPSGAQPSNQKTNQPNYATPVDQPSGGQTTSQSNSKRPPSQPTNQIGGVRPGNQPNTTRPINPASQARINNQPYGARANNRRANTEAYNQPINRQATNQPNITHKGQLNNQTPSGQNIRPKSPREILKDQTVCKPAGQHEERSGVPLRQTSQLSGVKTNLEHDVDTKGDRVKESEAKTDKLMKADVAGVSDKQGESNHEHQRRSSTQNGEQSCFERGKRGERSVVENNHNETSDTPRKQDGRLNFSSNSATTEEEAEVAGAKDEESKMLTRDTSNSGNTIEEVVQRGDQSRTEEQGDQLSKGKPTAGGDIHEKEGGKEEAEAEGGTTLNKGGEPIGLFEKHTKGGVP